MVSLNSYGNNNSGEYGEVLKLAEIKFYRSEINSVKAVFSWATPSTATGGKWGTQTVTAIVWKHEMSVGVRALDMDHKLILSLINQFDEAIGNGEGEDTVSGVISALHDYTVQHFGREEEMMAACLEFPKWRRAGGRILPGLIRRRAAEQRLFKA